MTDFTFGLEWNTLTILESAGNHLLSKDWKISNSYGMADTGESALILEASKDKFALIMQLENEAKQISIKGGIAGKYLPPGKQIPKYSKRFASNQIKEASDFFEKIVMEMGESGK
jgi:hypothetical protein